MWRPFIVFNNNQIKSLKISENGTVRLIIKGNSRLFPVFDERRSNRRSTRRINWHFCGLWTRWNHIYLRLIAPYHSSYRGLWSSISYIFPRTLWKSLYVSCLVVSICRTHFTNYQNGEIFHPNFVQNFLLVAVEVSLQYFPIFFERKLNGFVRRRPTEYLTQPP